MLPSSTSWIQIGNIAMGGVLDPVDAVQVIFGATNVSSSVRNLTRSIHLVSFAIATSAVTHNE